MGEIFRRANIPVVVAVNSASKIDDEVCSLFARHFYNYIVAGYSPSTSFKEALQVV